MSKENFNLFMEAKASKEDRVINYIATKEIVDSHGRLLKVSGMDLSILKQLKSIYWNHNTYDPPIGKAISVRKSGDEVRVSVKFAEPEEYGFADTIYKMVRGGYINGGSIGITADYQDIDYPEKMKVGGKQVKMVVNKSQLKEFSVTPTPANLSAVPLNAALEAGVIDELEANEFKIVCKDIESETNDENSSSIDEKSEQNEKETVDVASLTARVAELELLLKEQEMEEESKDSIYTSIYDEFTQTKDNKNIDSINELHNEYIESEQANKDTI